MSTPPIPASLQRSLDATKVEYVQLGTSGLRVSSPILGTMGIGDKDWQNWVIEEEEGLEILKAAWDRGVTTWDTANVYSSGINEEIVGKAITKFEIPRHKLTLLTKCSGTVPDEPSIFNWGFEAQLKQSKDYVNQGGLSRTAIFHAVDASLRRLGTTYIDLLQIHRYDPSVQPEETMKALHDLVQSGKVRYIGASSMWTYQFARMQFIAEKNGWTKFISMQNSYNLCYREEEREMMKFCKETGVGLIPYGPLFNGLLAKPTHAQSARSKQSLAMAGGFTEADQTIIKRVEELAEKKGWNMSQVALAWIRGKGCVPIVGLTSGERMDDACAVRDMRLTDEETKYLEEPRFKVAGKALGLPGELTKRRQAATMLELIRDVLLVCDESSSHAFLVIIHEGVMPFPSHGCRTCKRRRVKCDETRPICNRCRKANLTCDNVEDGNFIFLNENEFVVGRRKRPRGPNVSARIGSHTEGDGQSSSPTTDSPSASSETTGPALQRRHPEPRSSVSQTLETPIAEQALNYYFRNYLEMEHLLPDIADSHLKYVATSRCFTEPDSILSLAIFAVSHATFGRARRSHASLAAGCKQYSKALEKTNLALQNPSHATDNDVLLAIMLLSFYENSVTDRRSSPASSHAIQAWASRSFAHHDGALAVLRLRRQTQHRTGAAHVLDKLVRRQLMRSLLLRSLPLPSWLEDGFEYGEYGFALELDTCLVDVAKIRHRAKTLFADFANSSLYERCDKEEEEEEEGEALLYSFLEEAYALDGTLVSWTEHLPLENWYTTHTVKEHGQAEIHNRVFNSTVHIYPTVGHAGMWNRYRALRLAVHDTILQALSILDGLVDSDSTTEPLVEAVKVTTEHLSDDICASVPYMLGLVEAGCAIADDVIIADPPASTKRTVKATTAGLLCWPLATAVMVSGIPEKHELYLKSCLLEVSEIVDDGVLERLAVFFPRLSKSSSYAR
ncbi:hypothetical protein BDBG_16869 [Blastomyces gilchristii SLH14081]|uniref:Zn(2)-C6 fungal-type domain-containing protein n=1 Tax=Blastomyces gilchristii (strain SLH14081) TaxID=559298 RepID=A0A179UKE8_BLAGS|nr:uncharacterized protein BDBG_16869 [Blastomyces gilchristii SLH14081]OAT07627.1 hypothetical protein BDBG_16869 [Blastomyces gilchristii SLH14081]